MAPFCTFPDGDLTNSPKFGGALGSFFSETLRAAGINFSAVEPEDRRSGSVVDTVAGKYDAIIGLLQEGRADLQIVPYNIDLKFEPVNFGPMAKGGAVRILSVFESVSRPVSFVDTYNVFTDEIWSLFISSLLLLALCLTLLKSSSTKRFVRNLMGNLWVCFSYVLQQGSFSPQTWKLKCLLISLVFCTFYLDQFYCNKISTDIVATDNSGTIESMEDLAESGLYPVFLMDDPSYLHVKDSDDPAFAKVWSAHLKRQKEQKDPEIRNVAIMETTTFMIESLFSKMGALVMEETNLKFLIQIICPQMLDKLEESLKQLIVSKSSYLDEAFAPYYSKHLSQEIRLALDVYFYHIIESGLYGKMLYDLKTNPMQDEFVPKNCWAKNDAVFSGKDDMGVILENIKPMFYGLFAGLIIALIAFTGEVIGYMKNIKGLILHQIRLLIKNWYRRQRMLARKLILYVVKMIQRKWKQFSRSTSHPPPVAPRFRIQMFAQETNGNKKFSRSRVVRY